MVLRKMIAKIKDNKGFSLTSILVAVVIIGILAFPMAKWFMSTAGNIGTDQEKASAQTEKMEMQSIIQSYWQKMIDMSYDEFQAEIKAKGTKRTETLGKYDLTIEFSGDSKYANALCNVGTAAGASDRHCRRANITLVSKQNPSMVESFYATRVQPASTEAKLLKLTKDLKDEDDKFKDYDTKTEADNKYACPWDYKMNAAKTACVACDAPSNWKQYRSGNCTLGTCPTGKRANSSKTGCEVIPCSGRTQLVGDSCTSCSPNWKQYYTASSGCAVASCPTGRKANAAHTGCEVITCGTDQKLEGDTCVDDVPKGCQNVNVDLRPVTITGITIGYINIPPKVFSSLSSYLTLQDDGTYRIYAPGNSYNVTGVAAAKMKVTYTIKNYQGYIYDDDGYCTNCGSEDEDGSIGYYNTSKTVTYNKGETVMIYKHSKCGGSGTCTVSLAFHGFGENDSDDFLPSELREDSNINPFPSEIIEYDSINSLPEELVEYDYGYSEYPRGLMPLSGSMSSGMSMSSSRKAYAYISSICIE